MTILSAKNWLLKYIAGIICSCCYLLPGQWLLAQSENIQIGNNFRIYPSNVTQTEVFITVHPGNSQILFASANTITFLPFFISEGVYVSLDSGNSWFGSDTCQGLPLEFHGGDPGIAIDWNGNFILTRMGRSPFSGLYAHYSVDHGQSWSGQYTITTDDMERAAVTTDATPASTFLGRTYAVWVRFAPPYPVFFTFTDNGGVSWSVPAQINNPPQRCAGGDAAVGPDGRVHAVWAGVSGVSPFTEQLVGHAVSDDGGANWSVTETAFLMNGIQGVLAEKQNIRVNGLPRIAIDRSGGTRQGWIYVVTAEKNRLPAGSDPDIIFHRSSDGGQSWSPPIRVNQDALNNGKIQYFPAVTVDQQGAINVLYYDDRLTSSDSCGVFLSRSSDGGDSWKDFRISDHHFQPLPIGGLGQGYQGDNIDITVAGNTLWPVWMDNSSGIYQIWTVAVDISSLPLPHEPETANAISFRLNSIYPNPFNGSTTIEYLIQKSTWIRLSIYNVRGQELRVLINQQQHPGIYRITFHDTALSSGIYILKIAADGFFDSRPLLLIK